MAAAFDEPVTSLQACAPGLALVYQQIFQVYVPFTGLPGMTSALTGQPLTSTEIHQWLFERGTLGKRQIGAEDLAALGLASS